jgi:aryl-alcohol dehydrogenase-like predicted oxidoreductase
MYQARYWDELQLAAVEELAKEAEGRGLGLASVAVAWVLAQPGITSAIIGASRPDQLDATLAGAELELAPDLAKLCDAVWWRLPRRPVNEGYR